MKYFIYESEYQGATFYADKTQWEKAVDDFDFLGRYCDDGWAPEVKNVIAGIIPDGIEYDPDAPEETWMEESEFYNKYATHRVEEIDRRPRPDDVGTDGMTPDGEFWSDWNFKCNYVFSEVAE